MACLGIRYRFRNKNRGMFSKIPLFAADPSYFYNQRCARAETFLYSTKPLNLIRYNVAEMYSEADVCIRVFLWHGKKGQRHYMASAVKEINFKVNQVFEMRRLHEIEIKMQRLGCVDIWKTLAPLPEEGGGPKFFFRAKVSLTRSSP